MNVTDNRMFTQMLDAAVNRICGKNPEAIAENADIEYSPTEQLFRVKTMGTLVTVSYPDFKIEPELEPWHQLVILHYMDLADGTPLNNQLISFSQVKHGMVRGGGFDRDCEVSIQAILSKTSPAEFEHKCFSIGGKQISTNADFAVCIPFLPRYPITVKIWYADEEFPASGKMMLDSSSDHYLTIEDAVTVGALILDKLAI